MSQGLKLGQHLRRGGEARFAFSRYQRFPSLFFLERVLPNVARARGLLQHLLELRYIQESHTHHEGSIRRESRPCNQHTSIPRVTQILYSVEFSKSIDRGS